MSNDGRDKLDARFDEKIRSAMSKISENCPYCGKSMPFYEIAEHKSGHESERVRVREAIEKIESESIEDDEFLTISKTIWNSVWKGLVGEAKQ